jgi:hypothetical protein
VPLGELTGDPAKTRSVAPLSWPDLGKSETESLPGWNSLSWLPQFSRTPDEEHPLDVRDTYLSNNIREELQPLDVEPRPDGGVPRRLYTELNPDRTGAAGTGELWRSNTR